MPDKKGFVYIEVNGGKYICSVYYSKNHKLWFGETLEGDRVSVFCCAGSRQNLLSKLKIQLSIEIKRINLLSHNS
jgi:hypothetical protein